MADDGCIQLENGEIVVVGRHSTNERTYEVVSKLGEGGFSAVYKMLDKADGALYAMKTESKADVSQRLKMEVKFLKDLEGSQHFCHIVTSARTEKYNFVIMTLTGRSIADLRRALLPPYRFTLGTSMAIAIKTLEGLEDMHKIGYLHRDVKPANFCSGRPEINEQRKVYVLDFGLCRQYRTEDGSLRTPRTVANFRGTTRYAPLNCFFLKELSRKDDIESWLYMMIEMVAGNLPWRAITDKPGVKAAKLYARTSEGKAELMTGCPKQFGDIMDYCDVLNYVSMPDYQFIYKKLRKPLIRAKPPISESELYDWEVADRMQSSED